MLSSRTERINLLRRQYQNFLLRITNPSQERRPQRERSFIREEPQIALFRDDCSLPQKSRENAERVFQHPTVKKALEKDQSNEDKIEILDKYLESISSQRCRDLINQEREAREKLEFGTRQDVLWKDDGRSTNHATAVADDIMNSIYSRYYNKTDGLVKDTKLNLERDARNGTKERDVHFIPPQVKIDDNLTVPVTGLKVDGVAEAEQLSKKGDALLKADDDLKNIAEDVKGAVKEIIEDKEPVQDNNYQAARIPDTIHCNAPIPDSDPKAESNTESHQDFVLTESRSLHQMHHIEPNQQPQKLETQQEIYQPTDYPENYVSSDQKYKQDHHNPSKHYYQQPVDEYELISPHSDMKRQNVVVSNQGDYGNQDDQGDYVNQSEQGDYLNQGEQGDYVNQGEQGGYVNQDAEQGGYVNQVGEQGGYVNQDEQGDYVNQGEQGDYVSQGEQSAYVNQGDEGVFVNPSSQGAYVNQGGQGVYVNQSDQRDHDVNQGDQGVYVNPSSQGVYVNQGGQGNYVNQGDQGVYLNPISQGDYVNEGGQSDYVNQADRGDYVNQSDQGDYVDQYPQEKAHQFVEQPINEQFLLQYDQTSKQVMHQQDLQSHQQVEHVENRQQGQDQFGEYYENDQPAQYHQEGPKYTTDPQVVQQYQETNPSVDAAGFDQGTKQQHYGQDIIYDQTDPLYNQSSVKQYEEEGQDNIPYNPNSDGYDQYGQLLLYDQQGQAVQAQYDENGQIIPQYDENGQIIPLYDQAGQQYIGGHQQQYDEHGQPMVQYDYDQSYNYPNQIDDGNQRYYDKTGFQKVPGLDEEHQVDEGQEAAVPDAKGEQTIDDVAGPTKQEDGEEEKKEDIKVGKVMDILDTDTESSGVQQNTSKISNDADFDFS